LPALAQFGIKNTKQRLNDMTYISAIYQDTSASGDTSSLLTKGF